MNQVNLILQELPGVDILLNHSVVKLLIKKYRYKIVLKTVRNVLSEERNKIISGKEYNTNHDYLANKIFEHLHYYEKLKLKPVINGTGILLHTNLGRAFLGKGILKELENVIGCYSNLEFNLDTGNRGKRKDLFADLARELLDVEDIAVVNNNAAAVFLCLKALAENKEVIVSRSELIEIGDSFRIPDIMKISGVKMVEVGTTNKTKLKDYEDAINSETAVLFKTHRSNFTLKGFVEEAQIKDLVKLSKEKDLITMCDIGSGLLFSHSSSILQNELSVEEIISQGIDLVMFSGDKLLGGPQCGIIAGKKELISKIERHPLMRTYRVDKLTISLLLAIFKEYLYVSPSMSINPVYYHLTKDSTQNLLEIAKLLFENIDQNRLQATIAPTTVQCGGGSLPEVYIDSYAVEIRPRFTSPETLYFSLMQLEKPIIGFIKQGRLVIDLFCIAEEDIFYISKSLNNLCNMN